MNRILLVDDDEDDRLFFMEALELINPTLQCDTAHNGLIALEKLKSKAFLPDLIFLDLNMPFLNGFDFLIQIKKEKYLSKIPIGIISTSNIIYDRELSKELGANFFLTKPNDFKVLGKKLKKILSLDFSTNEYISV